MIGVDQVKNRKASGVLAEAKDGSNQGPHGCHLNRGSDGLAAGTKPRWLALCSTAGPCREVGGNVKKG